MCMALWAVFEVCRVLCTSLYTEGRFQLTTPSPYTHWQTLTIFHDNCCAFIVPSSGSVCLLRWKRPVVRGWPTVNDSRPKERAIVGHTIPSGPYVWSDWFTHPHTRQIKRYEAPNNLLNFVTHPGLPSMLCLCSPTGVLTHHHIPLINPAGQMRAICLKITLLSSLNLTSLYSEHGHMVMVAIYGYYLESTKTAHPILQALKYNQRCWLSGVNDPCLVEKALHPMINPSPILYHHQLRAEKMRQTISLYCPAFLISRNWRWSFVRRSQMANCERICTVIMESLWTHQICLIWAYVSLRVTLVSIRYLTEATWFYQLVTLNCTGVPR